MGLLNKDKFLIMCQEASVVNATNQEISELWKVCIIFTKLPKLSRIDSIVESFLRITEYTYYQALGGTASYEMFDCVTSKFNE